MSDQPLRVVLTGSECTGKTTLARELAELFATSWSPEYVRDYLAGLDRPLAIHDVALVGEGQVAGEELAALAARRVVFHDTDLWSTVVYSRHYFGDCPRSVEKLAEGRRGDLYLLHHPDVPWVAEALQREGGGQRPLVHEAFVRRLAAIDARVVDVRGSWTERRATAVEAVQALLTARKHGG